MQQAKRTSANASKKKLRKARKGNLPCQIFKIINFLFLADGHFDVSSLSEQQLHVKLYDQFLDCVVNNPNGKIPRWLGMHNGSLSAQWNQNKFNELKGHQIEKFFFLAKQLQKTVDSKFGGKDNFFGFEDRKWNIIVWFGALLDLALVEETENNNDCWISQLQVNKRSRPQIKFG